MTTQYYQLIYGIDAMLQKVNDMHKLRFIYRSAKKSVNRNELNDLNFLESIAKPFFDPYAENRQIFAHWMIQSDIYITNSRFEKDRFLKRFLKQCDKVQIEFDKVKINSAKLIEKIEELRIHLDALEQHGKRIDITPKLQKIEARQSENSIILEKGKTAKILKQVSEVFNNSTKFLKVMDKWVGVKTLEYFIAVPDVPVRILTSNIEKKSQLEFQVLLKRINETRSNPIDVHLCDPKEFHDRYIINGEELWMIGSSLKDVGYKNWTTLNRITGIEKRKELDKIFNRLWKKSIMIDL